MCRSPVNPIALALAGLLTASGVGAQRMIFTLTGQADGDHFGWSVREAGDLDRDSFPDILVGAPFDDTAGANAGSVSIISGRTGIAIRTLYGSAAGDCFGYSASAAGDVNGDGRPDLIIGAPGRPSFANRAGSVRIVSGSDYSTLYTFAGVAVGDSYGFAVNAAGDVDNDGRPDVLIGAPGADGIQQGTGYAEVRSGRTGAIIHSLQGRTDLERFGFSLSGIGDTDGDGHADFIIGAPFADPPEADDAGHARQFSGRTGALVREFAGILAQSHLGSSVRAAGDVNGDMIPDYVIGARFERDRGQAHVISGADATTIRTHLGTQRSIWFGQAVASAGDVDGDGFGDVVVGAPVMPDTPMFGAETVFRGSIDVFSGQTGSQLFRIYGPSQFSWHGFNVSGVGDINKDGFGDIAVGVPMAASGKGQTVVISGRALPLTTDTHTVPVTPPGFQTQNFTLDEPTQAGRAYLVLGSASGIVPGFTFGGVPIALNPDGWLSTTLSFAGLPPLINTLGVLDGAGRGSAAFQVPGGGALSVLNGLTLHHAFVTFTGGSIAFASNAVPMTFVN